MLSETAEIMLSQNPDRLIMTVPGIKPNAARAIALNAVRVARGLAPRMSGRMASRMYPLYGKGYFGIGFQDSYAWFQEHGIRPFTMYALAGKTVPMWIDDPTGTERSRNPKAKTRVTLSGKTQVLIFRRAAQMGQRKTTMRKTPGGVTEKVSSPMSYPGAPGRIGARETGTPWTTPGRLGGAVARQNTGVRWRHPGLAPRLFLNHSLTVAAQQGGILPLRIYACDRGWRSHF
jgi:hypothetical protein